MFSLWEEGQAVRCWRSDVLFSFSRRRKHLETVALRHNMRPWPIFFGNAGGKSLLEALIMKLNRIIHRRLLRSQGQYPLFSRGSEVRLANDLLLLNARGLLSRKVANIRCQRTDVTGRERKKNAPAQATIQNARNQLQWVICHHRKRKKWPSRTPGHSTIRWSNGSEKIPQLG